MKILLTGASGFAGAHMLNFLLNNTNHEVICPVTYRHGGHVSRIPSLISEEKLKRVRIFEQDLALGYIPRNEFTEDVEMIINFASESHVDRSIVNPIDFSLNNTNLMINLLEYARTLKNVFFLHISTDEVYGSIPRNEKNIEWQRPHLPSNPYSASKSAQESLAIAYFKTYKIPIAIVNATNMIGETQNQEKFLPKIIHRVVHDYAINIDTDANGIIGSRKYIYVGDVATAVWSVAQRLLTDNNFALDAVVPLKYHLSGEEEISNLQLVEWVSNHLNKVPKVSVSPSPRPGYDLRYELTTEKIRSEGWKESRSIAERVKAIVDWTIKNPKWLYIDYEKLN